MKLLIPGAVLLEEIPVEGGDANNEIRSPDLVLEGSAISEQIHGVPGKAERDAEQPGTIHADRTT